MTVIMNIISGHATSIHGSANSREAPTATNIDATTTAPVR